MRASTIRPGHRTLCRTTCFAFFATVIVGVSLTASSAIKTPAGSGFSFHQIEEVVSDPHPTNLSVLDSNLFDFRGVVLQARASFKTGAEKVSLTELKLRWEMVGEHPPTLCVEYKDSCTTVDFPEEAVLRLAYWISTSQSTLAFTYLPKQAELFETAVDRLRSQDYELNAYKIRIPDFVFDGTLAKEELEPGRFLVHGALNSPFLVGALGYLDFADGLRARPGTDLVVQDFTAAEQLIEQLNGRESAKALDIHYEVLDRSYTNADVHSSFRLDLSANQLQGVPLRYYWTRKREHSYPLFHEIKQFRERATSGQGFAAEFGELHNQAIQLYRVAAILRAFQFGNPTELLHFTNSGLARNGVE